MRTKGVLVRFWKYEWRILLLSSQISKCWESLLWPPVGGVREAAAEAPAVLLAVDGQAGASLPPALSQHLQPVTEDI